MLQRGASFSSTICSWFCELEALFMSNTSHMLRGARHQQQGLHHLFQTTAQCDPLHSLTTNHTMFDDVVNPLLARFPASGFFSSSSFFFFKLTASPEQLLICALDNERFDGGREEEDQICAGGWSRPYFPQGGQKDRRKTEAHEQGHAPPFQSAAAVSHGSRASRGEVPP